MPSFVLVVWKRAVAAILTAPDVTTGVETIFLFCLLALMALPLGLRSGFLRPERARITVAKTWGILVFSFLSPAFVEELIFRVAPLPRISERPPLAQIILWSVVSLFVFVVYHPVKAKLLPSLRRTPFANPAFLLLATLVGAICTISYLRSGSLWPPVILHWLSVAAWLLTLGGWRKMHGDSDAKKEAG